VGLLERGSVRASSTRADPETGSALMAGGPKVTGEVGVVSGRPRRASDLGEPGQAQRPVLLGSGEEHPPGSSGEETGWMG
jgi:hypothetical protein